MQSILKIDFYSRNALPDQEFKKKNYHNMLEDSDLETNVETNNDDEALQATEQQF